MSEILQRHLETCPVCSEPDEDGNERVCRTAKDLARDEVVGRAAEHSIEDPFTVEITVRVIF